MLNKIRVCLIVQIKYPSISIIVQSDSYIYEFSYHLDKIFCIIQNCDYILPDFCCICLIDGRDERNKIQITKRL